MSIVRFARPAGTTKPLVAVRTRSVVAVNGKEVFIGNHKPTDHFASAAQRFVPAEQLYDNRERKR